MTLVGYWRAGSCEEMAATMRLGLNRLPTSFWTMTAGRSLVRVGSLTYGRATSTTSARRKPRSSLIPAPHPFGRSGLYEQAFRRDRGRLPGHRLIPLRQQRLELLPPLPLQPFSQGLAHDVAALLPDAGSRRIHRPHKVRPPG